MLGFQTWKSTLAYASAQLLRLQLWASRTVRRVMVVYARRAVFAS
jgi:hypothetical protein